MSGSTGNPRPRRIRHVCEGFLYIVCFVEDGELWTVIDGGRERTSIDAFRLDVEEWWTKKKRSVVHAETDDEKDVVHPPVPLKKAESVLNSLATWASKKHEYSTGATRVYEQNRKILKLYYRRQPNAVRLV